MGTILDGIAVTSSSDNFTFNFRRVGADVEVENHWISLAAEFIYGDEKVNRAGSLSGASSGDFSVSRGYYVTVAGKTPWGVGPLVRYDVNDDFRRWTLGGYYGPPKDPVRFLVNYELHQSEDTGERGDDKLYLMLEGHF